ncbi:unnamed protein product [Caenorhabditis brenneri]
MNMTEAPEVCVTTIQILIPFRYRFPCDLLISNDHLKIGNSLVSFFMTLSTFFPISITFERFIATVTAESYEKRRVILGPIFTVFNILLDASLIFLIYKSETFDDGSISFVFFPKTLAPKMFTFFCTMLVLNSINFIFNAFLLRQNNRMNKNSTSSLATKYQREEVYQSTKFAIFVIFFHFLLFGVYVIGIIILRYFGDAVIKNPINLVAARGFYTTMITLYNLVIGSVAILLHHRLKKKKTIEITGTIRIEATGNIGARNYDNAILDAWNSVSRR